MDETVMRREERADEVRGRYWFAGGLKNAAVLGVAWRETERRYGFYPFSREVEIVRSPIVCRQPKRRQTMAERWAHNVEACIDCGTTARPNGWIGVFAAMCAEVEAERDDGGAV